MAIDAPPVGLESTTVNCSVGSLILSPTIATVKFIVVVPGVNVSVAVFAMKSLPASAVPATVVATTVIVCVDGFESVTATLTFVVFLSPSVTEAFPTESLAESLSASVPDAVPVMTV